MDEGSHAHANDEGSGPRRKSADRVEKFRAEYDEALDAARVQQEHTLTDGWRSLYQAERKQDREERRKLGDRLQQLGKTIAMSPTESDELLEKEIGEIKKSAGVARERREHFELTTVKPVKDVVEECNRIVSEARREARLLQEGQGLIHADLIERMDAAIKAVPVVEWDEERGAVVIGSRGKSLAN